MIKWISIKGEPPKEGREVLGINKFGEALVGYTQLINEKDFEGKGTPPEGLGKEHKWICTSDTEYLFIEYFVYTEDLTKTLPQDV